MKQRLIFVAGFFIIFATGLYIGEMRANRNSSEPNTAPNSASNNESPLSSEKQSLSISVTDTSQSPSSFESQSSRRVTMDLLQAWGKPKPVRTAELLSALEEVTTVPLTKELLAVMRQILDGREIDEVDYLLSVLEQREEKASVAFLADALDHPQQDIRDRALMACEAVAGTIFSDSDAAKTWAQSWEPNPAVTELFSAKPAAPETSTISPTQVGPAGSALRNQADSAKLTPAHEKQQKETPEK